MTQLTEEEIELQKKFAILRKHKKILSDLKKQRKEAAKSSNEQGSNKGSSSSAGSAGKKAPSKEESKSKSSSSSSGTDAQKKSSSGGKSAGKPEESEKTAEQRKEEAKALVAKGLIKINPNERKKQEFKRSRNLERRLEDPDKSVSAPVEYTPFSAATEKEKEGESKNTSANYADKKRKMGGYDNFFVKSGDRRDREETADEDEADLKRRLEARDRERESERERRKRGGSSTGGASSGDDQSSTAPKKSGSGGAIHRDDLEGRGEERKRKQKGNTVFVKGHGLNEEIVKSAFDRFGKIVNLKNDSDNRNNWFVTYLDQNDASSAIRQMDNTMVSEIHLHVALARHQIDVSTYLKDTGSGAGSKDAGDKDAAGGENKKAKDWMSMASSTNHKSEHEDKRNLITYDIDDEFD